MSGSQKTEVYKNMETAHADDLSDSFIMVKAAEGMTRCAQRLKAAFESGDAERRQHCIEELTLVLSMLLRLLNKEDMTEAVDAYHEILSYMLAITLKLDREGSTEDVDKLIESFGKMRAAWLDA